MRRSATEHQSLVNRVKALTEALEGSDIGELDLTENGLRIYIRRRLDAVVVATPAERAVPSGGRLHGRRPPTLGSSASHAPDEVLAPDPTVAVVAPLTGVFYSAGSPDAEPFVKVGDTIQPGESVCMVEAMKVFNEIKAEVGGTVTAIVAKNGQLVQKGDALIRVRPV
jgi:acetyl-CoA carboxylase biotin carboxyl carrier protein